MTRDLYNLIKTVASVVPVAPGVTTVTGSAIDTRDYDSGVVVLSADGDVVGTWSLTECDTSDGTYTAVAAGEIHGTQGQAIADGSKLGYVGSKRYIKPVLVVGTDGVVGALGILSRGKVQQPVV